MPNPRLKQIVLSRYDDAEFLGEKDIRELARLLGLAREDVKALLDDLSRRRTNMADALRAIGATMLWSALRSRTSALLSSSIESGWSSGLQAAGEIAKHMGEVLPSASPTMLDMLRSNAIPFADAQTKAIEARIRGELVRGLLNKDPMRQIADRMIGAGLRSEGTVWKSSLARADTTIRTEVSRAYHAAMTNRLSQADWITGYQYLTQPEGPWPCSRCEPFHGQFFPKGTEPMLPKHPSCRCLLLPTTQKYGTYDI